MTLFILRFFYYFLFLFGEQRSEYFLFADTDITKRDHGLFAYQLGIGIAFPVNDYIISGWGVEMSVETGNTQYKQYSGSHSAEYVK